MFLAPALIDQEFVGDPGYDFLGVIGADVVGGEVDRVARDPQVCFQVFVDCLASSDVKAQ